MLSFGESSTLEDSSFDTGSHEQNVKTAGKRAMEEDHRLEGLYKSWFMEKIDGVN